MHCSVFTTCTVNTHEYRDMQPHLVHTDRRNRSDQDRAGQGRAGQGRTGECLHHKGMRKIYMIRGGVIMGERGAGRPLVALVRHAGLSDCQRSGRVWVRGCYVVAHLISSHLISSHLISSHLISSLTGYLTGHRVPHRAAHIHPMYTYTYTYDTYTYTYVRTYTYV